MVLKEWLKRFSQPNSISNSLPQRPERIRRYRRCWLESLEARITLDAAPYLIHLQTSGTLSGSGNDYAEPANNAAETLPFASQLDREILVTPGQPYSAFGDFWEEVRLQDSANYQAVSHVEGFFFHTDTKGPIGQPESVTIDLDGFVSASGAYSTHPRLESFGDAVASLTNVVTSRIRIWDVDCPLVGTPVTGDWSLATEASINTSADYGDPFPGQPTLEQDVTIRFWRKDSEIAPLVLAETKSFSVPVGRPDLWEEFWSGEFSLTTGSEIELVVETAASATSSSYADSNQVRLKIGDLRAHHIDVLDYEHYTKPGAGGSGVRLIDPQWIAVEYEVTRPICYFDLEFSATQTDVSGSTFVEKFRISPEIIAANPRFRHANPVTGSIEPAETALQIGRHWLLIDGNQSPDLRAMFESNQNELLMVQEPGFPSASQEFHGFFQATPTSTFVVRSDANTEDQVILNSSTVEFTHGGEVYSYDFELVEDMPAVTQVLAVTVGQDDQVLAFPNFAPRIEALLGADDDIFVGGAGSDTARGGPGNDALLGEGWDVEVTTLTGLFEDMLDLKFSLQAGLVPAAGAADSLYGDAGDDFLLGGAGGDLLESGPGRSVIFGDSLEVTATIQVDFDDLKFGADIDFVRSGAGNDTVKAGSDDTLVMGGGGNDSITGNTAGISLLFGNAGNDTLHGRSSFDVIAGGDGDDTIDGTGFLIGDSFSFSTFSSASFDNLKQGNFTVGVQLTAEDTGNDGITGGSGFDFIVGGDGDDMLAGGDGLNIVFGDAFDLSLSIGINFNEVFSSDNFLGVLSAPLGILNLFDLDFEFVESGNDIYQGGSDTDVVFGGAGDDELFGYAGFDFLVGGAGDDLVDPGQGWLSGVIGNVGFGGPGNDRLLGSDDPDHLESESGDDTFFGGGGDDRIFGGNDGDVIHGGPGNDQLYGEGGDDQIFGDEGDDEIFGGSGNDALDGGSGNNSLTQESTGPSLAIGDDITYGAGQPPVFIADQALLTDEDSAVFLGGNLIISNPSAVPGDVLGIQHQGFLGGQIGLQNNTVFHGGLEIGQISGGLEGTPLVVILNQRATPAVTEALLRQVTFRSPNSPASATPRTITVQVTDGEGGTSNLATKSILVTASQTPLTNPNDPFDIQGDGDVDVQDAIEVLRWLRRQNGGASLPSQGPPYLDPTSNGAVTVEDALVVIRELRRRRNQGSGEGEPIPAPSATPSIATLAPVNQLESSGLFTLLAFDVAEAKVRKGRQ